MLNVFKNKFSQIHKQSKEAKELLRFIGPGILVTVGFIDPGNWAANLAAGADYGYASVSYTHLHCFDMQKKFYETGTML